MTVKARLAAFPDTQVAAAGPSLREVRTLISHYIGLKFQPLGFAPAMEKKFEEDGNERRCARLWLEGLIMIGLFDLFLIPDYFATPASFMRSMVLRLGIVTPLALLVNVAMLFQPRAFLRESSIAAVACLAGVSQLFLSHGSNEADSAYAQFGILAVILFTNCVMRLRFLYTLAATAVMILADVVFLQQDVFLSSSEKMLGFCLTLSCCAGTLVSNYSSNREDRLNYLFCLQGDLMMGEMSKANEELQVIAEQDKLTGLVNRRAFDDTLLEHWDRARRNRSEISLILIDIDHFKLINDRYGHLYGDRVLARTGRLLRESMRRKDDLAARYGGEEFVVLLPDTPRALALLVAERIRNLVQTAGLPAPEFITAPMDGTLATVSCGVASCVPGSGFEAHHLLNAADKALYRAKAAGRNRVHAA